MEYIELLQEAYRKLMQDIEEKKELLDKQQKAADAIYVIIQDNSSEQAIQAERVAKQVALIEADENDAEFLMSLTHTEAPYSKSIVSAPTTKIDHQKTGDGQKRKLPLSDVYGPADVGHLLGGYEGAEF